MSAKRHIIAPRYVTVHSGARDGYQLTLALAEAGMLEALVTDVFWATDGKWTKLLTSLLPSHFLETLRRRAHPTLASGHVKCCLLSGLLVIVLDKLPRVPFAARRFATRHADAILGGAAGELATRRGAGPGQLQLLRPRGVLTLPRPRHTLSTAPASAEHATHFDRRDGRASRLC